MTLRRRLIVTSLVVALPAALVLSWAIGGLQRRERAIAVYRYVDAQMTDVVRDACEDDPMWFLAGPRAGRPSAAERARPDAELYLPRPSGDPLPLEIYAYDQNFGASSTAAPRFPEELRRAFRRESSAPWVTGPFATETGEGVQVAMITGWRPGPCAVLLARYRPEPGGFGRALGIFAGLFVLCAAIGALNTMATERRVRRLTRAARASVRNDYAPMEPVAGRDEISALGFIVSQAGTDLRRRAAEIADREDALQRHVGHTSHEVAGPLAALEGRLASLGGRSDLSPAVLDELREMLGDAHHALMRLENLEAVARLRTVRGSAAEAVDVAAIVSGVVARLEPVATAAGVRVETILPTDPVQWPADASLLERAVANLVDNAIRYNDKGGHVRVELGRDQPGTGFTLRVTDDGPGVDDETFEALTAKGRFRGDEGRAGRPGRGLGLAVAREVADRFGLMLMLSRPPAGGFEVALVVRSG